MQPIPRTEMSDLGRMAGALGAVVERIGRPDFDESVGALLVSVAPLEQCILFQFDAGGAPRCLHAWHRDKPKVTAPLVRRYVEDGHYRRDPLLGRLPRTGDGAHVGFLRREHIEDAWYRGTFFDGIDVSGKMSVLERNGGESAYLNFYTAAGESLSDRAIDHLLGLSGAICRSIARHHALTSRAGGGRVGFVAGLLARSAPQLTARERAVCARIVAGYSGEAIALDLGVAESSVATYRKRAYAKLGICSQHALFALCLDATAGEA